MQSEEVSKKPKKSKPSGVQKPQKPVYAEIYRELGDCIRKASQGIGVQLEESFLVMLRDDGSRAVLKRDDYHRTVEEASFEQVQSALMRFIRNYLPNHRTYALTPNKVVECVKQWFLETDAIPKPKPYGFLSDPEDCFGRVPFDLIEGEPTPTFDAILSRSGAMAQTIRHWIGSIFVPEADRSTYLWLYGTGGDGKGSLIRVLGKVLGPAHFGSHPPRENESRFWTKNLVGKRLVTFPECKRHSFVLSEIFMGITGGDTVHADVKMREGFSFFPECLCLFASNLRPNFGNTQANIRRALYAELEPRSAANPDTTNLPRPILDARLWKEAPSFLGRCQREYLRDYPDFRPIEMPDDSVRELAETNDEHFNALANEFFKRGSTDNFVPSSAFLEVQQQHKLNDFQLGNLKNWMRQNWGIKPARSSCGNYRGWTGIIALSYFERTKRFF